VAKKAKSLFSGGTFIHQSRAIPSEQKAIYHNVTGAGRSRVIRKFLGLTDQNQADLRDGLERLIAMRIQRGTTR
jgi:hypothetical protein